MVDGEGGKGVRENETAVLLLVASWGESEIRCELGD